MMNTNEKTCCPICGYDLCRDYDFRSDELPKIFNCNNCKTGLSINDLITDDEDYLWVI